MNRHSKSPAFNRSSSARLATMLAASVLTFSVTTPVWSQPPQLSASEASDRADALLKEGIALANERRLEEGRAKLTEAFGLKKSYDIAANLAHIEDELEDYAAAATHLDFAIRNFPTNGKPEHKATLRARMDTVLQKVAVLEIQCNEPGATVLIDDKVLGSSPVIGDVFVALRMHEVEAKKEGFKLHEKDFDASAGGRLVVVIHMEPIPATGGPDVPVPGGDEGKPIWPAILLGSVAAAGLGVGIAGVVVAAGKSDDADALAQGASCNPVTTACLTEGEAIAADRGAFQTMGVIGFAACGLAAVGLIIYIAIPSDEGAPVEVRPTVALDGGGISLFSRF